MPNGVFDLSSYSGTADQRIEAAYADCVAAGGGTIFIPAGEWRITESHTFTRPGNDALAIVFAGVGSASRIVFEMGDVEAFFIGNFRHVVFCDLTFLGVPSNDVDCYCALDFGYVENVVFCNCNFYGIRASHDVLNIKYCGLLIEDCGFYGTGHRQGGAVCINEPWNNVVIQRTKFIDLGSLGGIGYSKSSYNRCWVRVLDQTPGSTAGNANLIRIEGVGFDEHALSAVLFEPTLETTRHKRVEISNVNHYACAHPASVGMLLKKIDRLTVRGYDCRVTTSQPYMKLVDVSAATVEQCRVDATNDAEAWFMADAKTLLV